MIDIPIEKERDINYLTDLLSSVWYDHPTLRFGQLIALVIRTCKDDNTADDFFYIEDNDLIKVLENMELKRND